MTWAELHREVRARLRTLSKENAEVVGGHLVMAGRLLDLDPERAYQHAQAAVRRGGRVDVVREAAGLAAYRTGRHAEALRELRTVRRLSGSAEHLAVMADCERGLGRPERAIALANDPDVPSLPLEAAVELAMVVSGARLDMGQPDAAVAALDQAPARRATGLLAVRVAQARSAALEAAGRDDEAAAELARYTDDDLNRAAGNSPMIDDDIVVYDLTEDETDEGPEASHPAEDPDRTAEASPSAGQSETDQLETDQLETDQPETDQLETDQPEVDPDEPSASQPAEESRAPGGSVVAVESGEADGRSASDAPETDQGESEADQDRPVGSAEEESGSAGQVEGDEPGHDDRSATDEPVRPVEAGGVDQAEENHAVDQAEEDHAGAVTETEAPAESVSTEEDQ